LSTGKPLCGSDGFFGRLCKTGLASGLLIYSPRTNKSTSANLKRVKHEWAMSPSRIILGCLILCQIPGLAFADTPSPLAEFVRELRGDAAFATQKPRDWDLTIQGLQTNAARGDVRAQAGLAAVPAYLAFQSQLANRKNLSDVEGLRLYQQSEPILCTKLPEDLGPLNEVEALAINLYTATTYLTLNQDIANHRGLPSDLAVYTATLDQALAKLPAYDGIVYHVQDMRIEDIHAVSVGKTIKCVYYLRTSGEKIGWQGNVRMVIHTRSGRVIENYSVSPQEHEVLISRAVTFRVSKAPVLANGVYTIEYDEVTP